ncbi:MAG TPA: cupin domain-containing protein [Thermoanaerobaculia bacterium]|nr:cupin domain-containing protein [Thermoanaerobaculia bacterium]
MTITCLRPSTPNRREALQLIAATGAALTLGCCVLTPLDSRRTLMKTTAQDAATVTPKVVKVKLENEHVRVLDFMSEPGDKEDWHFHPAFVVYVVTGGTLRITTPDGKSEDVVFKAGDILYREPRTHRTENIGKTTLHAIIVELKSP